ncbi:MAG: type II secretion system F family protein [Pseudomonadota bacterium]
MMETLLLGAVFAAVVLVVVGVAGMMQRDPALRRMASGGATVSSTGSIFYEKKRSKILDLLEPMQKQLAQSDAKQVGLVKNRLIQAGYYHPSSVEVYYTIRVGLALGLVAAAILALLFLLPPTGANNALILVLGGASLGYYLPALILGVRIKDRKTAFRNGMPDAMDMILVGVEAGLSLPASIKHLCEEFGDAHPIIAEQFRIVMLEFQAGKSRPDALASLAKRMDVQEARVFATMIAQSETLGTSLATTLRVLADEMRRDRMLKAEQKAAELPVKMAVPLVMLIFPALFSVIMTPLAIRIFRALSGITL